MEEDIEASESFEAWVALNERRSSGAEFALFVEQFQEAVTLLQDGSPAQVRLALEAVDSLAESLLRKHMVRAFEASERRGFLKRPRFDQEARARISDFFSQKVALATRSSERWWYPDPILDAPDASVFDTGHGYRNEVHHEGRNNWAVMRVVTQAYAGAVLRAFARATPTNDATSQFPTNSEELLRLGYKPDQAHFGSRTFAPAQAARAVATFYEDDLTVEPERAGAYLSQDLLKRVRDVRGTLKHLLDDGMEPNLLLSALAMADFWENQVGDKMLIHLDEERINILDSLLELDDEEGLEKDNLRVRYGETNKAYDERVFDLLDGFKPAVNLGSLNRIARIARSLPQAKHSAAVLERYREMDRDLRLVERVTDEAAADWDQWVQHQVDIARGK
jgi:hypothetical protein